jgi:hypothetical protein
MAKLYYKKEKDCPDMVVSAFDYDLLVSENMRLKQELKESQEYADKLAQGLPVGMLPADIENLRETNAHFAQKIFEMEAKLSKMSNVITALENKQKYPIFMKKEGTPL